MMQLLPRSSPEIWDWISQMPQASDKIRALMVKWFGTLNDPDTGGPTDLPDDAKVLNFLYSHGYTEESTGWLRKPTPNHSISDEEWYCLRFMIDEWDYAVMREDTPYIRHDI